MRIIPVACAALCAFLIAGCVGGRKSPPKETALSLGLTDPLENVIAVLPGVFSGSAPMDESGYEALARLNIETVISVDGARPSEELAAKYGMEVVHIPLRYSGVEPEQRAQLSRALRDSRGPVYVHCHHGKHRGPAATAVALIGLGRTSTAHGERILELAGTSPEYPGLWASVRACEALSDEAIDAAPLLSSKEGAGEDMGSAMARMEIAWYRLLDARERGWGADPSGKAPAPIESAGEITESMRALASDPSFEGESEDFRARMLRAIEQAAALEHAIEIRDRDGARARFEALGASCRLCHRAYRD